MVQCKELHNAHVSLAEKYGLPLIEKKYGLPLIRKQMGQGFVHRSSEQEVSINGTIHSIWNDPIWYAEYFMLSALVLVITL